MDKVQQKTGNYVSLLIVIVIIVEAAIGDYCLDQNQYGLHISDGQLGNISVNDYDRSKFIGKGPKIKKRESMHSC